MIWYPTFLNAALETTMKKNVKGEVPYYLKNIPKSFAIKNMGENLNFFADKGKWIHDRFKTVILEIIKER